MISLTHQIFYIAENQLLGLLRELVQVFGLLESELVLLKGAHVIISVFFSYWHHLKRSRVPHHAVKHLSLLGIRSLWLSPVPHLLANLSILIRNSQVVASRRRYFLSQLWLMKWIHTQSQLTSNGLILHEHGLSACLDSYQVLVKVSPILVLELKRGPVDTVRVLAVSPPIVSLSRSQLHLFVP